MNELKSDQPNINFNSFDKFISHDIHYLALKFITYSPTPIFPDRNIIKKFRKYVDKDNINNINKKMVILLQNKITNDFQIKIDENQNTLLQTIINKYIKIILDDLQY